MSDIKLYVCGHERVRVPRHPLLVPIQAGAALVNERFEGWVQDDEGENISQKNRSYCELTALYYAWKNCEADYVGLFHYRRYLYLDVKAKRPYRIEAEPSEKLLEKLGYGDFARLIEQYDLILPKREDMHVSVREHYARAKHHRAEDLALVERIVRERYPEYEETMEQYLSDTECYFGNIAIMKREVLDEYCEWLFGVLEEFDRRAGLADEAERVLGEAGERTPQEMRVDGYLAERLLGVWATKHSELKLLELPRVHFERDRTKRWKMKLINALLPPGSRRRARVKGLVK